jgi:Domain of unknown function DUF11
MPPQDGNNRIEELKSSLYNRGAPDVRTRRKLRFADVNSEVNKAWQEPTEAPLEPTALNTEYKDHSMSFFTKFLIGSIVFCIIAVGIGLYFFLNGANLISGNNIDVVISGPVSIAGGAPVSFGIKVTNNNTTDLQLVDLSVAFPAGATNAGDSSQALNTYEQLLGDIPVGQSTSTMVSAIIFGEENSQKTITATITYQVKGSSAVFTKIASYDVIINSSPITLSVDSFSSVTSGQEYDMKVSLKSNSTNVLKNVELKAQYPFGYTFLSSNVPAASDNATWNIGDIPPGGSQTIVIHGKLVGQDTDTQVFHFTAGAASAGNNAVIGTQYGVVTQNVSIEQPFMSLALGLDDDTSSSDIIGHFGTAEHITVSWANNLSVAVSNAVIEVDLSGSAYDKSEVEPDVGYFDSADNKIVWNQETNPELANIPAGASGSMSFTITPNDSAAASGSPAPIDPQIAMSASVTADRTQESDVSGNLTAATSRTIKVASNIALSGSLLRTVGPFTNTGPVPPQSEQKTTYTVLWTISNTTSSVSDAQVTATLPPYVTWLGNISPSTENVTFDPNTGLITWNAGSIQPDSSNSTSQRRQLYFQIAFQPSITQVDMAPPLVNQANLTATDDFTQAALTSQQDYLTTSFSTDPGYAAGDETVVGSTTSQ